MIHIQILIDRLNMILFNLLISDEVSKLLQPVQMTIQRADMLKWTYFIGMKLIYSHRTVITRHNLYFYAQESLCYTVFYNLQSYKIAQRQWNAELIWMSKLDRTPTNFFLFSVQVFLNFPQK